MAGKMIKNLSVHSIVSLFLSFAIGMFVLAGCDKSDPEPYDPIPEIVLNDFNNRYPGATLLNDHFGENTEGWAELKFIDSDGVKGTAHYKDGLWMMTNKEFSKKDFLLQIPRKVARTYVGTGVENEDYSSDNSYVMEISRRYLEKKQYEFCFEIPYEDKTAIDGLVYATWSIAIDEDGDLLYYNNDYVNPSYWWKDITSSLNCVVGFLPIDATILGCVNKYGDNLIFFKHDGIVKTAVSKQGLDWGWDKTYFPIDSTNITKAVADARDTFLSENEGYRFTTLYDVKDRFGRYYGLKFEIGDWKDPTSNWSATTIYIPANDNS